ncbi:hypothetical protein P692DRAFT_20883398 [Suillus brevipes Sb2]|nr:hypothetical protein P692DRAFT_20883398 [Suillus brevipes Sb2]
MSAPSSPYSECSSLLTEYECAADPIIVKMLVAIIICRHGILHYHAPTAELTTFQWPTDRYGHKIHPSQFEDYRRNHTFRYPCCLCATGDRYVEASIFRRTAGICEGEYVAECATGSCGYMVNIEKYFGRACVPAVYYPRREITNRPARYRQMLRNPYGSIGCAVMLSQTW